jgi:hypothetical protein
MAPRRTIQPQISTVWAESLIELSMKVPGYWWDGCNDYKLHDGKLDSFDIQTQKWNLILDDRNEPFPFIMAYDAVSMYADEDSSTIDRFHIRMCLKAAMRLKLTMVLDTLGCQLRRGLELTLKMDRMMVEEQSIRLNRLGRRRTRYI